MGHIKEPDGVDFVINSRTLTKEEEIAISEFIRNYKVKQAKKQTAAIQANKRVSSRKKAIPQEK
jgi:hypothetical protein